MTLAAVAQSWRARVCLATVNTIVWTELAQQVPTGCACTQQRKCQHVQAAEAELADSEIGQ